MLFRAFVNIKNILAFLAAVLGLNLSAGGQGLAVNHHALKLIDSAKLAFCRGDTSGTISLLEHIEQLYPSDALIIAANKVLADIYQARGDTGGAKAKLLSALNCKPNFYYIYRKGDDCALILNQDYSRLKADICVDLSRIYLAEKMLDSSGYFLTLADTDLLPYKDCGNGILMYRSFLSPFFADHFLATGDTARAIARLLDFFMIREGNTKLLTQKLKTILLHQYTKPEIRQEVENGLRTIKVTQQGDEGNIIHFTVFGHTIQHWGYGKSRQEIKKLKDHPALQLLLYDL